MVPATKLRAKFGPEGSVETFKTSPDINNSDGQGYQSKKRRSNYKLEEVQAKKKQTLDCILSSQCLVVLKLLMEHHKGWIFNVPVDPVKLMIPDYFSIISNPMDLGTVKSKLMKNEYSNVDEFAADVRLTFDNAMMYNPTNNWAHQIAKEMKELFEVRWELLMKKKASKISRVEVKEGLKRSHEASASSGRFSVEEPKPKKVKFEKVSCLSKPMKGQSKKEASTVRAKTFATKSNKADLNRRHIEKEEMERTQREEKARIEARRNAAKIADLNRRQVQKEEMERTQREEKARIEARRKAAKIADLTRRQIEKEEMERTQREEKARIEAGMKAAKIAARMRARMKAQTDLKQKRARQRLELEKMKKNYDFDENNHWRLEIDFFNICGSNGLRRVRQLLKELGLVLRNDYWPELEEIETKKIDAMRLDDDIEEGEIV